MSDKLKELPMASKRHHAYHLERFLNKASYHAEALGLEKLSEQIQRDKNDFKRIYRRVVYDVRDD